MTQRVPRAGRRAFLTTIGASLAGIVLLGCGGPPTPGKIGQRVQQHGIAVLLKEAVRRGAFSRYNATSRAQPDQTYVLMRIAVENVLAPRFESTPAAYTLMTAEGRIFKPLSVGFHIPEPAYYPLAPGQRGQETAVFEIPAGSGGLTLTYQPARAQPF